MGFLVDENLPVRLAAELIARGYSCQHVADLPGLRSSPDDEVIAYAEHEGLVLISRDKELSFLTRSPDATRAGVVCVRIKDRVSIDEQVRIVVSAIASIEPGEFAGNVVVIEPGRIRIRRAT